MSMETIETRGYVRGDRTHNIPDQEAKLLRANCAAIFVEGRNFENLDHCILSLREGDTLAVTTVGRLHSTRDGIRAAIDRVLGMGVMIWEVDTDRRIKPGEGRVVDIVLDALDELSGNRHKWNKTTASKAAMKRWNRTPATAAERIWKDWEAYPTAQLALEHPDMAGWTKNDAYRKFGKRGSAPWTRGEREEREAKVYFMRDGTSKRIKIGVSTDVEGRRQGLKHSLLGELKILATVPGGYAMEKDLHKRFKDYQISGEWFKMEGDLAGYVKSLPKYKTDQK